MAAEPDVLEMLIKRILTSIIILAILAAVIFILPAWASCLVCAAFIISGLIEFFGLAQKKGIFVYKYCGLLFGVLFPVSFFLKKLTGIGPTDTQIMAAAIITLFLLQFIRRDKSSAFMSIAVSLFGLLYIAWFFSFFVKLRFLSNGPLWMGFVILVSKFGDIGAYFIGNRFGRHSLIQRISPNKSVEGALGGFLFSILTAFVLGLFLPDLPVIHILILGISLGILAQLGDLAESLIKRDVGVKDSGRIIPGFGGVLDMIDSVLFTAPFLYFYLTLVRI